MTTPDPDDPAALLAEHRFTFTEDPPPGPPTPVPGEPADLELDEEDLEFQPRQRHRLHWLTIVLIALVIWGAGFLAGVLVDRAVAGLLG
jgi:hypothetical protein